MKKWKKPEEQSMPARKIARRNSQLQQWSALAESWLQGSRERCNQAGHTLAGSQDSWCECQLELSR